MIAPHTPPAAPDVAAIEARAAAATTLPWEIDAAPGLCGHDVDRYHVIAAPEAAVDVVALVPRVEGADADAALIVAAVNALPALLAALRAERAQHAADVAAAVRKETRRCMEACEAIAERERTIPHGGWLTPGAAARARIADACAAAIDAGAIAAPTGGGE